MVYTIRYYNGSFWSVARMYTFIDALLYACKNAVSFQIWLQDSKKLSSKTLVAYTGDSDE